MFIFAKNFNRTLNINHSTRNDIIILVIVLSLATTPIISLIVCLFFKWCKYFEWSADCKCAKCCCCCRNECLDLQCCYICRCLRCTKTCVKCGDCCCWDINPENEGCLLIKKCRRRENPCTNPGSNEDSNKNTELQNRHSINS